RAVGEAGFQRGVRLAVDDDDLVAFVQQVPGGGDADDAGAENDDLHARGSQSGCRSSCKPRPAISKATSASMTRQVVAGCSFGAPAAAPKPSRLNHIADATPEPSANAARSSAGWRAPRPPSSTTVSR